MLRSFIVTVDQYTENLVKLIGVKPHPIYTIYFLSEKKYKLLLLAVKEKDLVSSKIIPLLMTQRQALTKEDQQADIKSATSPGWR